MRKLLLLLVTFVFFYLPIQAQQRASLEGSLKDTINSRSLEHTSIVLLRAKDSTLYQFTRADGSGRFRLGGVEPGNYLLLVSHPSFLSTLEPIAFGEAERKQLPDIYLFSRNAMLTEVVIKQVRQAIRVKGDTTEYLADSFLMRPNATVEDLLKRLPGVQVDGKGNITAQGQQVQKVLVDGDEFFADDPGMVIKGLNADMVDKVQVYDKKSEQAEFTGIDDGSRTKTINLQLKEDKKKGLFGKLKGGYGTDQRYLNEAMANIFKGRQKFTVYGIMANNGRTGLEWSDRRDFSAESSETEVDAATGSIMVTSYGDEFSGESWRGEGIPESFALGAQYSNKWNANKRHVNGSYRFNQVNLEAEEGVRTQYILPDTLFYNNQYNRSNTDNRRHSLTGFYETQLDSLSSLKMTLSGSRGQVQRSSLTETEALNEFSQFVNSSVRRNLSDAMNDKFNGSLLYRKKFKKVGQTLVLTGKFSYNLSDEDGLLQSVNRFYNEQGDIFRTDTIDQKKDRLTDGRVWDGKAVYTHPLSKQWFLETNYQFVYSNNFSRTYSFDKVDDKYEDFNRLFSIDFDLNIRTHLAGSFLRYNAKKVSASFGLRAGRSVFDQTDNLGDTTRTYRFANYYPSARFNWRPKPQRNLGFGYSGSTRQPTLDQLQPIRENSDPLNIVIGNPALRPEFNHAFDVYYSDFKVLKKRYMYANASFRTTTNAIVPFNIIDSLGRRINQYINDESRISAYGSGFYNRELDKGFRFEAGGSLMWNRGINFLNGIRNITNNYSISPRLGFSYSQPDKLDLNIDFAPSYNFSESSVRTELATNYWLLEVSPSLNWPIKPTLYFNTNLEMNFRQRTEVFQENNNVVRWNAKIGKIWGSRKNWTTELTCNDILNQNLGFSRDISSNFISERTYNTIQRYFMFHLIWNFRSKGALDMQNR